MSIQLDRLAVSSEVIMSHDYGHLVNFVDFLDLLTQYNQISKPEVPHRIRPLSSDEFGWVKPVDTDRNDGTFAHGLLFSRHIFRA